MFLQLNLIICPLSHCTTSSRIFTVPGVGDILIPCSNQVLDVPHQCDIQSLHRNMSRFTATCLFKIVELHKSMLLRTLVESCAEWYPFISIVSSCLHTPRKVYASSVKAVYSSFVIIFPSGSPSTVILAIHASPSGSLLIFAGVCSRLELTSATVPLIGVRMSEADFTDSTAPMASPELTSMSVWGSSM
jgi:hypothetical protein